MTSPHPPTAARRAKALRAAGAYQWLYCLIGSVTGTLPATTTLETSIKSPLPTNAPSSAPNNPPECPAWPKPVTASTRYRQVTSATRLPRSMASARSSSRAGTARLTTVRASSTSPPLCYPFGHGIRKRTWAFRNRRVQQPLARIPRLCPRARHGHDDLAAGTADPDTLQPHAPDTWHRRRWQGYPPGPGWR